MAAACGPQLRARVWPLLLGVESTAYDPTIYAVYASEKHRDSSTVEVDVQRSIWSFTEGEPALSLPLLALAGHRSQHSLLHRLEHGGARGQAHGAARLPQCRGLQVARGRALLPGPARDRGRAAFCLRPRRSSPAA